MDRITAIACFLTVATAVIFFDNRAYFKKFYYYYFIYVEVRIVIMSSQLTIFLCNRAKWNLWFNFISQVCYT